MTKYQHLMMSIGAIGPLGIIGSVGFSHGGVASILIGLLVGFAFSCANIYGIKVSDKFFSRWISRCVEQKRSTFLPNLLEGGIIFYIMISCCLGLVILYGVLRAISL